MKEGTIYIKKHRLAVNIVEHSSNRDFCRSHFRNSYEVIVRHEGREYGLSNIPTEKEAVSVGYHTLQALEKLGHEEYHNLVERGHAEKIPYFDADRTFPVEFL